MAAANDTLSVLEDAEVAMMEGARLSEQTSVCVAQNTAARDRSFAAREARRERRFEPSVVA